MKHEGFKFQAPKIWVKEPLKMKVLGARVGMCGDFDMTDGL